MNATDHEAIATLKALAAEKGMDMQGARVRRSSSRFCLGVEHGDYNGTELFGVGTDRFIWMAYKPNGIGKVRLFSGTFPGDGVIEFEYGSTPPPGTPSVADTWARFPYGVDYVLKQAGFKPTQGFDAVLTANIPGGGMSRSASLSLNLILTILEVNGLSPKNDLQVVDLSQQVETDYIGSPSGNLDQIMIFFAKKSMGTHWNPKTREVKYIPLGDGAEEFRIMSLDTGTNRPGLEKSTYKIRREECDAFAALLKSSGYPVECLADVRTEELYQRALDQFRTSKPDWCDRLTYIYEAQKRFYEMMEAWKGGDVAGVGRVFRADGVGLRDQYKISGPELETMCDIARTVPGVLGERMLGGGDKGAAGALVLAGSEAALRDAITAGYPRSRPAFADRFDVQSLQVVDGITCFDGQF